MTDAMRKLIDETKRLDAAASAGPWHERDAETENGYSTSAVSLDSADDDGLSPADLLMLGRNIAVGLNMRNAALIADYRTAAPVLAAEVERLDARLAEVERERDEALLTLAAEQGRQEGAPSSEWRWTGKVWFHPPTCMVVEPADRLWRLNPDAGDPRHWRLSRLEPMPARDAMKTADAPNIERAILISSGRLVARFP